MSAVYVRLIHCLNHPPWFEMEKQFIRTMIPLIAASAAMPVEEENIARQVSARMKQQRHLYLLTVTENLFIPITIPTIAVDVATPVEIFKIAQQVSVHIFHPLPWSVMAKKFIHIMILPTATDAATSVIRDYSVFPVSASLIR